MSDGLPEGWVEIPFETIITELRNGVSAKPNLEPPGTSILRISAVRSGKVLLDDCRYLVTDPALVGTYRLRDGDLLFTRYNGSLDLLGVCGMVRGVGASSLIYPDKLMRVRVDRALVSPSYVELFFGSPEARSRLVGEAKSSAGQQGVSGSDLKRQILRLAPTLEQRRIVEKVESLIEQVTMACDRVTAVARILGGADVPPIHPTRLIQAILQKAFSGELVPTEAELARAEGRTYESAEQLLARVRAEPPTADAKPAKGKARSKAR